MTRQVVSARTAQRRVLRKIVLLVSWCVLLPTACSRDGGESPAKGLPDSERPAVLLITLDTTRADRLGIESSAVETPNLNALADRGRYFTEAYSTTPTTLPSHTSMMTGSYPMEHGIRENGRRVGDQLELLAVRLKGLGYKTAAFVSGFPLARQFGLARGFDTYDDTLAGHSNERDAAATTNAALDYISQPESADFLWVHYFDAHAPYEPPEPFRSQYADDLYSGELAYIDSEVGRLLTAFEARFENRPQKILVVGDHGEGLGDHGEALHGNLLYQGTMRVPMIIAGDDIAPGKVERAVSVRQVFDTVLDWAGVPHERSLLGANSGPVLGEALKPYLQYGWQPQFMAVLDGIKMIQSGDLEVFDLRSDPDEINNLAGSIDLAPELQGAISNYAARALDEADDPSGAQESLSQQTVDRLASLGYIGSSGRPVLRAVAPNPKDMVHLYSDLDIGSGYFTSGNYDAAIEVFGRILEADPYNFMAAMRLAVANSVTDRPEQAQAYFERARSINPSSVDLRHYHAMHYLRNQQWNLAEPLFESVLAEMPDRLPALEGLATIYTRQRNDEKILQVLEKIVAIKPSPGVELVRLGQLHMAQGDTAAAIGAFERASRILGRRFGQDLELGVLYLADRQFEKAAISLDKVTRVHPGYAMALFKRAQVSVLLNEADRESKVRLAWQRGDNTTRRLIASEKLFRGIDYRSQ
ncbi:MAG TPA: sulfatase-like hydrolase/transferase [Woeseiaceae bacterium]|nr:sulfatase-like hydrolase/transferase [Woeseiaceae bacterium]